MSKKITVDKLGSEIDKILAEYGDYIETNLDLITKKIGQKGAAAVRNEARDKFGGTGKYASGWTATTVKYPHYTSVVIHNKNVPGLPHLLEHGHAMQNGGRVEGRPHIEPVESELLNEYMIKVINII